MNERYQETLPLVSEYGFFQPQCCFVSGCPTSGVFQKAKMPSPRISPTTPSKDLVRRTRLKSYQLQWHRKTSDFWKEKMNQMECKNKLSQQFRSHPFTKKKSWGFNESAHLGSHLYGIDDSWQPVCQVPEFNRYRAVNSFKGVTTRGSKR